jgi:hypothetical protein
LRQSTPGPNILTLLVTPHPEILDLLHMITRSIALASLLLLAACSSGADMADDTPGNDSTLDAITGRGEEKARERLDKAEKEADARAAEAGADEPR